MAPPVPCRAVARNREGWTGGAQPLSLGVMDEGTTLEPLAYHRAVVDHLRAHEPETWAWAEAPGTRDEQAAAVRAALLRETYRLEAAAHGDVHADCAAAMATLGLDAPVTLYQAGDGPMNASLYFVPGEVHLLFHGPVLERLAREERVALLGHELAHYRLWSVEDGAFHTAVTILDHALAYPNAATAHVETARVFRLMTELYADRGAALAAGAVGPAIATLVKTVTGAAAVDADAYLRQATEAEAGSGASQGQTHPETFLRAGALDRWWRDEPDLGAWLDARVRGTLSIAALDLMRQDEATAITRGVLARLAADPAADSDAVRALLRRYFPDWRDDEPAVMDAALAPDRMDASFREYLVALSLDVAMADADPDARGALLAAGARLAAMYHGIEPFRTALKRDLKWTKPAIERLLKAAA